MFENPFSQYVKEFSKETAPEERSALAREITEQRIANRKALQLHQENLQRLDQEGTEAERLRDTALARIQGLNEQLAKISKDFIPNILQKKSISGLEDSIRATEQEADEHKILHSNLHQQRASLENEELEDTRPFLRQKIQEFYIREYERWKEIPSPETAAAELTEEHLAQLSLEDYVKLWRRYPCEVVTHVTRQGIRDHLGSMDHTVGVGEFHNGFVGIMEKRRLQSVIGKMAEKELSEDALAKYLKLEEALASSKTKTEAFHKISTTVSELIGFFRNGERDYPSNGAGSYPDFSSVHFAAEEAASYLYGAEEGNEIFYVFPSIFVASQYFFRGQPTNGGGGNHNDVWVWPRDEKGLNLDAGIVFLPADANVDPANGSRYQVIEGKGVEDEALKETLRNLIRTKDEHLINLAKQAHRDTTAHDQLIEELHTRGLHNRQLAEYLHATHWLVRHFRQDGFVFDAWFEHHLEDDLLKCGALYKKAEQTVPSKEYWEKFFAEHPEKRPSKLVYYTGGDPTAALRTWREEQGLVKVSPNPNLGFEDHSVWIDSPQALKGIDRFESIVLSTVEKYFGRTAAYREWKEDRGTPT
jgi:hypothetical protein